jgi:uncharacterized protein
MIARSRLLWRTLAGCVALLSACIPGHALAAREERSAAPPTIRHVVFSSGRDRIFGTIEIPARAARRRVPGVLLIAGSGATDRNGNSPAAFFNHIDTLRHFAAVLASDGVASLRYDKFGTGQTGISGHPDPAAVGFNLYVNEARAAYRYLAARPEIDVHQLAILGHSEGGLIALILGNRLVHAPALRALGLAAPPGLPILETIREQVGRNLQTAVQTGQLSQVQADAALAELDRIIAQIKQHRTIPSSIQTPGLASIFNPVNIKFLVQDESYDPQILATHLRRTMPVLLLHGKVDVQVSESDIHGLQGALQRSGHTHAMLYDLPQVDHVFKEVRGTPHTNPLIDYDNPALSFSHAATRRLRTFVRANL